MATKPKINSKAKGKAKTGKNASSASANKPKGKKPEAVKSKKPRRSLKQFAIRFVVAFVVLIFLVPAVLLFLYRFEFVHPVSTLMVKESLIGHGAWEALNKVIEDAIDGEKTRGASTITMQLVKNLFLWPNRSFIRKGLEVPYAMMAELILPKKRIMEIYLNIAEWDKGIFGVELAAQKYFNRSAAKLGPRYSSLLAVTLPNPKKRNAAKPTRSMDRVAKIVQRRAKASGAYVQCLK